MAILYTSTSSKKRGKPKFRNSEEARKYRDLQNSWENLKTKWGAASTDDRSIKKSSTLVTKVNSRIINSIPSIDTGVVGAVSTKKTLHYTGTKLIGIGTLHKSNAIPIFSEEEAVDLAKMRR